MDENSLISELNRFTRREFKEDEVYIFDVILCDNDIDRDGEVFSYSALETLSQKFTGVTGIFDHDPSGTNQTARIFKTTLVTDDSRFTAYGEPYTALKASAYMIRTDSNADLILEIDGGIKKEVSVSCSAGKHICSICGADRSNKKCSHINGKTYNNKICYTILDEITDVYEWSFVAVPAQVKAGVVKHFSRSDDDAVIKKLKTESEEQRQVISLLRNDLEKEIAKLCYLNKCTSCSKAMLSAVSKMSAQELLDFKAYLIKENLKNSKVRSQLSPEKSDSLSEFKIK